MRVRELEVFMAYTVNFRCYHLHARAAEAVCAGVKAGGDNDHLPDVPLGRRLHRGVKPLCPGVDEIADAGRAAGWVFHTSLRRQRQGLVPMGWRQAALL
jgi:hypothetical protein